MPAPGASKTTKSKSPNTRSSKPDDPSSKPADKNKPTPVINHVEDSNSCSRSGTRRSMRFSQQHSEDSKDVNTDDKNKKETGKDSKAKKGVTDVAKQDSEKNVKPEKPAKSTKGRKKKEVANTNKKDKEEKVEEDSCVIIDDSEPMDVDVDNDEGEVDIANVGSAKDTEKNVKDKEPSQVDLTKESQDAETQPPESVSYESESNEKGSSDLKSDSSSKSSDIPSIPQNVLGIASFTQLSSKSSESDSGSKTTPSETIESSVSATPEKVDIQEKEKVDSLSQPLLSWEQKLTQLSQSPKSLSPVKKLAFQESPRKNSPTRKGKSPFKSPKRTKKKLNDENDGKGALDKWIIRSPSKGLGIVGKSEDAMIVANVVQTLVEETQSPSKFSKIKDKHNDGISSSIMETPPKNVLESIPINLGNSHRKLFDSQSSNIDLDIVEDSNLVPASPNSKSFTLKTGTPVVKVRKLTDDDIRAFSPKRRDSQASITTPQKSGDGVIKGSPDPQKKLQFSEPAQKAHKGKDDDFSSFKALDKAESKKNESEAVEETLDDNKGKEIAEQQDELEDPFASSEELFSQETDVDMPIEHSYAISPKSKKQSTGSGNIESEIDEVQSSVCENASELALESQESSQGESEAEGIQIGTPSGRGRKRKQITPKKKSPEDGKLKRKKVAAASSQDVSVKKSSRLNEKRQKKEEKAEKETTKTGSPKDKVENKSRKTDDKVDPDGSQKEGRKGRKETLKKGDKESKDMKKTEENTAQEEESLEKIHSQDERNATKGTEAEHEKNNPGKKRGRRKKNDDKIDNESQKESQMEVETQETAKIQDMTPSSVEETRTINENGTVKNDNIGLSTDEKETEVEERMEVDNSETDLLVAEPHVGEQTPDTKTVQQAERRSTTKHKKEVAQKNAANKRLKEVVTIDSDSNADTGDELPELDGRDFHVVVADKEKSSARKQLDNSGDAERDGKEGSAEMSDESDDDIPIIEIKNKMVNEKQTSKETVVSNASPIGGKLRSNSLKKTRLRSAEKKGKTSPQAKKVIDLALKRTRNSLIKKKLVESEKSDKEVERESENEHTETKTDDESVIQNDDNNVTDITVNSLETVKGVDTDKMSEVKNSFTCISKDDIDLALSDMEALEETPKKLVAANKSNLDIMRTAGYSDSKLILGSRKFQKKGGVARRSILKPNPDPGNSGNQSPVRVTAFHPITVSRVYSPTASPSASILKRKRLIEEPGPDTTSSPPNKVEIVILLNNITVTFSTLNIYADGLFWKTTVNMYLKLDLHQKCCHLR